MSSKGLRVSPRVGALGGISALTVAALFATVMPAHALEDDGEGAARAAAVVEKATGTVDLVDVSPAGGGAAKAVADAPAGRVTTMAPAHADGRVTSSAPGGNTVSIGLPATRNVPGSEAGAGTVVYPDAARSTDLAIQPTTDGGLRTLVTLKDSTAATTQRFDLKAPENASLTEDGKGGYEVTRPLANGGHLVLATIDAPWAKDANGKTVQTWYRIDGSQLVQTIEADDHTAFPVVADPKITWGIVTGTAYFNKRETRVIADNGALSGAIGYFLPPGLNAYWGAHAVVIGTVATKAKSAKKCLKVKFAAGLFLPDQYSGGYCK
ncbi:hypothetical protein [Streptomyces sp. 1222.5]|uniref:hypothetical protein n=1 Tax=Streptomyces sp. 1222.5 TaxID=1881026 RepID=UPI003D757C24